MPNGPLNQDVKKLLNNGGLRAWLVAVGCLCDAAESAASSLNKSELLRLDRADRPLVEALREFAGAYESVFREAGARLLKDVE